jgi:hypothetical protein
VKANRWLLTNALPLLLVSSVYLSCSSTRSCVGNRNFSIDFSSGGGFTGEAGGITVTCDGSVKFWSRYPTSDKRLIDSLHLSSSQLDKISMLMAQPELFSYRHKFVGNYTFHLDVRMDTRSNDISFDAGELPLDMPVPVKDLISELRAIHK